MRKALMITACIAALTCRAGTTPQVGALHWVPWSESVFAQAQREHRFVLLDLEAVWCHWCHVMAETTYKDPATVALLQSKYITVRVDAGFATGPCEPL